MQPTAALKRLLETEPLNQLLQILVNLQMNAIHAMDGKGTLTISSEDWVENSVSHGAIVHVEDEGTVVSKKNF